MAAPPVPEFVDRYRRFEAYWRSLDVLRQYMRDPIGFLKKLAYEPLPS